METRTLTLTLAQWAWIHAALDTLPITGLGNQRLALQTADAIAEAVNNPAPAPQAEAEAEAPKVKPAKERRA
jgi:hypothetical protein